MADKILVNDGDEFLTIAKKLYADKAESWTNGDEDWSIVIFDEETQFEWHQRIFPAGMIMSLAGTNVRIFLEKERLV